MRFRPKADQTRLTKRLERGNRKLKRCNWHMFSQAKIKLAIGAPSAMYRLYTVFMRILAHP